MGRTIAVLGAGAIGSSVGADLTKAGFDVTIIDQWPAHVEAMKSSGLHIVMSDVDLRVPVRACHLCDLAAMDNPGFDIVFLAAKSYDGAWLAQFIEPYLKADGVLVGLQNSMNDDVLAGIIGRPRTMGCVVELSAEIFTPGLVQRNTTRSGTWFAPGELDGVVTPRAREIQSILRHVGKVDLPANIYGAKWTKLVVNSMTMGPFSLLGLRSGDALELPGIYEVAVRLGRETLAVGAALGYRIEPVFGLRADEFAGSSDEMLVTAMKTLLGHTGTRSRTAPIHDRLKGRRTEMDYINGLVSRQGRTVNVPTPCNDAVTEMARQINRGLMQMDPANLQVLKQRIGIA